jgi:hypothetical protein
VLANEQIDVASLRWERAEDDRSVVQGGIDDLGQIHAGPLVILRLPEEKGYRIAGSTINARIARS